MYEIKLEMEVNDGISMESSMMIMATASTTAENGICYRVTHADCTAIKA